MLAFFCSKHSKCTDTYEKIDEAALWDLLLFLSIFNLLGCTLRPRNTFKGGFLWQIEYETNDLKLNWQKKKRLFLICFTLYPWGTLIWKILGILSLKPRRYKAVWKENTTCLLLSDITEKSSSNAFFFLYTPFLRRLHRDHMCVNAIFFH